MSKKRALITGINGQDGAYLSSLLLGEKYEVYGAQGRLSPAAPWRLRTLGLLGRARAVTFDLADEACVIRTLAEVRPDEALVGDASKVAERLG